MLHVAVLVKLNEADADHCDPEVVPGGCRHDPCATKGLSKTLLNVADGWSSPLNNRMNKVFYVLLPMRKRLRYLVGGIARGTLPLSALNREFNNLPLLDRKMPSLPFRKKVWLHCCKTTPCLASHCCLVDSRALHDIRARTRRRRKSGSCTSTCTRSSARGAS